MSQAARGSRQAGHGVMPPAPAAVGLRFNSPGSPTSNMSATGPSAPHNVLSSMSYHMYRLSVVRLADPQHAQMIELNATVRAPHAVPSQVQSHC